MVLIRNNEIWIERNFKCVEYVFQSSKPSIHYDVFCMSEFHICEKSNKPPKMVPIGSNEICSKHYVKYLKVRFSELQTVAVFGRSYRLTLVDTFDFCPKIFWEVAETYY